jgi:hypothetical protein
VTFSAGLLTSDTHLLLFGHLGQPSLQQRVYRRVCRDAVKAALKLAPVTG